MKLVLVGALGTAAGVFLALAMVASAEPDLYSNNEFVFAMGLFVACALSAVCAAVYLQ